MCPALMLAANRKDSVKGRTMILVVSIKTRNGFNQSGAPSGRKWATDALNDFVNLDNTILSHTGKPIVSVKIRCLDVLNIYGIRPNKLIRITATKIEDTNDLSPFKWTVFVRDNWLKISCTISFMNDDFREPITQNEDCISRIISTLMHRKILFDGTNVLNIKGSKDEKISGIIDKTWSSPLGALKAPSFFNLMFYTFRRLSQVFDKIGLIR